MRSTRSRIVHRSVIDTSRRIHERDSSQARHARRLGKRREQVAESFRFRRRALNGALRKSAPCLNRLSDFRNGRPPDRYFRRSLPKQKGRPLSGPPSSGAEPPDFHAGKGGARVNLACVETRYRMRRHHAQTIRSCRENRPRQIASLKIGSGDGENNPNTRPRQRARRSFHVFNIETNRSAARCRNKRRDRGGGSEHPERVIVAITRRRADPAGRPPHCAATASSTSGSRIASGRGMEMML